MDAPSSLTGKGSQSPAPSLATFTSLGPSPASPTALFSSLTFQSSRDWAEGETRAVVLTRHLGVPAGVLAAMHASRPTRGDEDGDGPSDVARRATLRSLQQGDRLARETGAERLIRLRQRGALALESEWQGGEHHD